MAGSVVVIGDHALTDVGYVTVNGDGTTAASGTQALTNLIRTPRRQRIRRVRGYQPHAALMPAAAAGYSSEAQAFFDRVSDPGTTRKGHYATMIDGLVADGVWSTLDALYLFAAADAATALTSLISATYNATASGAPTFTTDRGYTGASGKYVSTNFNPTTASSPKFVQNSAHASVWSLTSANHSTGADFGYQSGNGADTYIHCRYTDDTYYMNLNCSAGTYLSGAASDGSGLWTINRTASNAMKAYRNGAALGNNAAVSATPLNLTFGVLSGGGTTAQSTGQAAMCAFGSALDDTKADALYDRVLVYLQAVGAV